MYLHWNSLVQGPCASQRDGFEFRVLSQSCGPQLKADANPLKPTEWRQEVRPLPIDIEDAGASSRLHRLIWLPQSAPIFSPAAVDPVTATLSTPGWTTRYSLTSRSAARMLTTPSQTPASATSSPSTYPSSAVSSASLGMTLQPASRTGTIFTVADCCGAFHGITAATMPTGS